jgi:diguanylate cyclase (GGDEF)-like protein
VWARVIALPARPEESGSRLFFTQVVDLTDQRRAQLERDRARRRDAAAAALSREAVAERSPRKVMVLAAEVLAAELDASHVAAVEVEPDGRHVRCVAGVGWPEDQFGSAVFPVEGSHAGLALEADGPVLLSDIDEHVVPSSSAVLEAGLRSGVACAIPHPDRPYGVVGVHAARPRAFDEHDAAFVRQVAEILSSAVQRAEAEERARHTTLHDALTGLPGRRLLEQRLHDALERAEARGRRAGVVLANVDALHLINEGHGHDAGDDVLRELAARLVDVAGSPDRVARVAGDELAVVCEGEDDEAIFAFAERVLAAVRKPIDAAAGELLVTASAGVAIAGERRQRAETLLREADVAMDRAKQLGRDRVEVYDEFAHGRALERLRLQTALRAALLNGELHLVYQPIVDLADGGVRAVEALLRWEHLVRGPIPPGEFIPVAESSGLIGPIGEFVVREACRQAAVWEAAGRPLQVTINVSVHQLRRRGFAAVVRDALQVAGVGPERLAIEITESALMEAQDAVLAGELQGLHDLGVAVHLDDFGTGYSSLSSLRDLRLHAVKIDRSFVAGLEDDDDAAAILRAMTTMARELGLRVIAEGVETEGERELVAELGCDAAQGYLFSPPVPAPQLDAGHEQPRL